MDPTLPQHDETIEPLRPAFRSGTEQNEPAASVPDARRNAVVLGLAGVALVIAVIAAFTWAPSREEEQAAAPTAATTPAPAAQPARPVLSADEEAALKKQAEDLLAGLLTLQDQLKGLNAEQWANEDWLRYQGFSAAGDDAFLANDFTLAVSSYAEAKTLGEAIIARGGAAVERSFNAGEAALAAGNSELAIEQYDLVLTIEPTHARAIAQRARAQRLPEVLALVQRADGERARGELEAALASYREALAVDPEWLPATAGVNDVNQALRNAEFERLLSDAYASLGAERFGEAQERFSAALAVRPGSREAQDGLVQAEQGAKLDQIALLEARALAFERRELWNEAIELYRSVLESDETLLFAQSGLERAQARAGLDAKLSNLLENPALLLTDSVLADARKLLESAAAEPQQGPRLEEQRTELAKLIALAAQPIPVRLTSDQLTSVTLYRVGSLGAFASRDLELRPGTYTVVGSRDGYRDVRQTFTVRPGASLPPINVICLEPI